jgi:hypothetical protein
VPFDFFNTGIPYDFNFAITISASMVLRFESNNFSTDIIISTFPFAQKNIDITSISNKVLPINKKLEIKRCRV